MTIQAFITMIDNAVSNLSTTAQKVAWINELEQGIYKTIVKEHRESKQNLVASQAAYTITGFRFEDVLKLTVNGVEYQKMTLERNVDGSYYKTATGLSLNPAPTVASAEGLAITYRYAPAVKTEAGVATETLSLLADYGDQWLSVYEYFIYTKLFILRDEPGKVNNYARLYEAAFDGFSAWYLQNMPRVVAFERTFSWGRRI